MIPTFLDSIGDEPILVVDATLFSLRPNEHAKNTLNIAQETFALQRGAKVYDLECTLFGEIEDEIRASFSKAPSLERLLQHHPSWSLLMGDMRDFLERVAFEAYKGKYQSGTALDSLRDHAILASSDAPLQHEHYFAQYHPGPLLVYCNHVITEGGRDAMLEYRGQKIGLGKRVPLQAFREGYARYLERRFEHALKNNDASWSLPHMRILPSQVDAYDPATRSRFRLRHTQGGMRASLILDAHELENQSRRYRFPPVTVYTDISCDRHSARIHHEPRILLGHRYDHPFVYKDNSICYAGSDRMRREGVSFQRHLMRTFGDRLHFANMVASALNAARKVLTLGYHGAVRPVRVLSDDNFGNFRVA